MKKFLLTTSILLLAAACNNNQQAQVQPAQNQETSTSQAAQSQPQATSTSADSDWKTYTNSQLGFSIEYPATWVFDSFSYSVSFTDSTGDQWMFGVEATSTTQTLQQASDANKLDLQYDTGLYATLEQSNISVDGQTAIQNFYKAPKRGDFYGDTQTFIIHGGKLYIISEGYGADPIESKMLESFKFTN